MTSAPQLVSLSFKSTTGDETLSENGQRWDTTVTNGIPSDK